MVAIPNNAAGRDTSATFIPSVHINKVLVVKIRNIMQRVVLLEGPVLRCTGVLQLDDLAFLHLLFGDHGLIDDGGVLSEFLASLCVPFIEECEVKWDEP